MTSTVSVQRTALYRLYDIAGQLLYVGITSDPKVRWIQHANKQPWWPDVASCSIRWHDDRPAAEQAERDAIKTDGPLWNVVHTPFVGTDDELAELARRYVAAETATNALRPKFYARIHHYATTRQRRRGWQTYVVAMTGLTRERIRQIIAAEEKRRKDTES